jgi:hypothetical protein
MIDTLAEVFKSIPTNSSCEATAEDQQKIMQACWTYNKLVSEGEKLPCAVCKWQSNKGVIEKYLRGRGKL